MSQRRDGLAVKKDAERAVEWVLELPSRMFFEPDPVLSALVAEQEADAAYEALCKYYVALTRAKRAMYVITEPVGPSASRNFPKLLEQTLGETWAAGEANWYATLVPERPLESEPPAWTPWAGATAAKITRLPSRRPSDLKSDSSPVVLFGRDGRGAADFGTRVHALFETVEWWDPAEAETWSVARQQEGVEATGLSEVWRSLHSPRLTAVFQRPGGKAEVWRERSFEVVLDGIWFTGAFDRVVVEHDATGRATRALVVDFKTDRAGAGDAGARAVEKHAGQLNLYRRVAARLTGLPEDRVRCVLVMTADAVLVEVPAG